MAMFGSSWFEDEDTDYGCMATTGMAGDDQGKNKKKHDPDGAMVPSSWKDDSDV